MKSAVISAVLIVFAAALIFTGCRKDDLMADMISFERAYVPALAMTKSKDSTGKSVMAVKQLKQKWTVFKTRYPDFAGPDTEKIEDAIIEADSLVNANNTQGAHEALEQIRHLMLNARMARKINYIPDRLTEFHDVMEPLMGALAGRQKMYGQASAMAVDAEGAWAKVASAPFKAGSYGFSDESADRLAVNIKAETEAIAALRLALAGKEHDKIEKAAADVRQGYLNVFKMFGDFERAGF